MEAGKGTPTSEGMLANFFNSLLNKSTTKTPGATKAGRYSKPENPQCSGIRKLNIPIIQWNVVY
jgi:hypothetical protein